MIRAPAFWLRHPPTLAARLLQPLGALYGLATARRMGREGWRAPVPVICVGNLTLGGAGKTPTALAIGRLLAARGLKPVFLSRGYGGSLAGPVAVDIARHKAAETGDEPLLLARAAPTVVARDRPAGARLALSLGADAIVMDDGLQNPSLARDFRLAVIDGASGFGNGLVFPAGPLRAAAAAQAPFIDAALVIGDGEAGLRALALLPGKPVFRARLEAAPAAAARLAGRRVIALAGLARPDKFAATLAEIGAMVEIKHFVGDHQPFRPEELRSLGLTARDRDLLVATTEKDLARMGREVPDELRDRLVSLPVSLRFEDEERIADALLAATSGAAE